LEKLTNEVEKFFTNNKWLEDTKLIDLWWWKDCSVLLTYWLTLQIFKYRIKWVYLQIVWNVDYVLSDFFWARDHTEHAWSATIAVMDLGGKGHWPAGRSVQDGRGENSSQYPFCKPMWNCSGEVNPLIYKAEQSVVIPVTCGSGMEVCMWVTKQRHVSVICGSGVNVCV
jgi:hypothetical protein